MENKHRGYVTGKHGDNIELVHRYQEILSLYLYGTTQPKIVLDVGAADGYLIALFKKRGASVLGIDIEPMNETVKKATIYDMTDEAEDLVIYNHVLEHCNDYREQLNKVYKVLKNKGYLFIAVPEASSPWAYEYETHVVAFTQDMLKQLVEGEGFILRETFKINFRDDKEEIWLLAQKYR